MAIEGILQAFKDGQLDMNEAKSQISSSYFEEIEGTTIDHSRQTRTGQAEVIFAQSKTTSQVVSAFKRIADNGNNVLATRVREEAAEALQREFQDLKFSEPASLASLVLNEPEHLSTPIGVITAGTSDLGVAEEAALTAEFYGSPVIRINDVGVAGIHRLFARLDEIKSCRTLVVVAGMEGALPSVVGGLVAKPVIAVPTSIGYGASFNGLAALLGMLNSCASGVSVVNIDNGFGAGFQAHRINQL
ncbi:MAG: nickel pincer cofactor biosynthesis protein LarB [Gammaproteobacteria bacterium]|nr:nickel pincer cofactor biosynthesis protein LarB [Gammaproteobacteria bacterium]